MKKIIVLDTNVLIDDFHALHSFLDCEIVIPFVVLEELDNLKKDKVNDVGKSSREFSRILERFRLGGDLREGVLIPETNSIVKISCIDPKQLKKLPLELRDITKNDNLIIATAYLEKTKRINSKKKTVLVSNDINVRVKCSVVGVESEGYEKLKTSMQSGVLYKGFDIINDVPDEILDRLFDEEEIEYEHNLKVYPNHFVILKTSNNVSVLAKINEKGNIIKIKDKDNVFGLKPKNLEQRLAVELLLDETTKLVTLSGIAGTGKTLIAVAAGMQMVSEGKYDKLIVTRPIQSVGKEIGFLPGNIHEKMEPWIAPIKDSLEFLTKKKNRKEEPYIEMMIRDGKIEIEAISFIRGRSIPKAFIIIDEVQNLTTHELKTILTRASEGTKIVLTGDVEQIDNKSLDYFNNGLSCAIEAFKEYKIAGHITMTKGERSELATIASKIL
jgi:PhoH-like ATPase